MLSFYHLYFICILYSDAFFFGLAQGVVRFKQSEGGSPGSPEMNFLYELGISDFVQSVADLLYDYESSNVRKGVVAGYIDDLYWAAPFEKMIEVIKFVMHRGPAYGYNLNMKKCVYLMAPLGRDMSQRELDVRLHALINFGIPIENIMRGRPYRLKWEAWLYETWARSP